MPGCLCGAFSVLCLSCASVCACLVCNPWAFKGYKFATDPDFDGI